MSLSEEVARPGEGRSPSNARVRAGRVAAAVAAVGLIATVVAAGWLWRQQKDGFDSALANHGQILVDSVADSIDGAIDRLSAVASLYRASDEVTEAEFRRFADDLGLFSGMGGIGYALIVESAELGSFAADVQEIHPDFEVFELDESGGRVPVGERARYAPLLHFEPFDAFERPHGFDLLSEPIRGAALERAAVNGQAIMTPFLRLVSEEETDGFVIYWPIEEDNGPGIMGFALAAMDLSDLIGGHLSPGIERQIDWAITDITGKPRANLPAEVDWSGSFEVAGRVWAIDATSKNSFGLPAGVLMLVLVGAGASLVAGATAYLLKRRNALRSEVTQLREETCTKNLFLASFSHEVRTPLTTVLGYGRLLQEGWIELSDDDRRSMVNAIVDQADDMEFLIQNLIVAARGESGLLNVGLVSMAPSAEVVLILEGLGAHGGGGVELIDRLDDTDRAIADPSRFRQIIRNLLDNAYRHGGDQVQLRLESGSGKVSIQVVDNGSGVSPADVGWIFEPYQRTHHSDGQPESLGIGLSIARQLARFMNGDLTYRREGHWTIFELTLAAGSHVRDDQTARDDATGTGSLSSIEAPRSDLSLQGAGGGSDHRIVEDV